MAISVYDIGDTVRCSAAFTNSAGAAADPSTVVFKVHDPTGLETTYTYPTDAQLVKDSVGNYHVDLLPTVAGPWAYRFKGTAGLITAGEARFGVQTSAFTTP